MKRKYPRRCARYFNNQIKDSLISNNSISSTLPSSIGMTFSSSDLDSRSKKILNGSESIQSVSEYEDKARSVSHEVLDSLIREGLKNKDYETVDLVLKEALELGKLTGATMESSIRSCIDSNEFTNAWVLFEASTRLDLTIGEEVSNKIAKYMVQQIFWAEASVAIEYSLRKGYTIEKNQILIVLGGLIGVRGELDRALSLLTVIADLRREDIIAEFNVTKVEKLATEYDHMKENKLTPDLPLLEVLFNSLRQAMVQDGWWSAPLTRLTVSLACVTGNYQPAIDFLR